jgi:hypothetical protein
MAIDSQRPIPGANCLRSAQHDWAIRSFASLSPRAPERPLSGVLEEALSFDRRFTRRLVVGAAWPDQGCGGIASRP